MFLRAQFARLDDLQKTHFDRLKIVQLFGPVLLKLREARRKETFHTITVGGTRAAVHVRRLSG